MNFLPGWDTGAGTVGLDGNTPVLAVSDNDGGAGSGLISFDLPLGIETGDLILVFLRYSGTANPAGLSGEGIQIAHSQSISTGQPHTLLAYKVADGSESGGALTPLNSAGAAGALNWTTVVLRWNQPLLSATPQAFSSTISDTNPAQQNTTSGSGPPGNTLAVGCWGASIGGGPTHTFSPTADGSVSAAGQAVDWRYFAGAPSNASADMADLGGANTVYVGYFELVA